MELSVVLSSHALTRVLARPWDAFGQRHPGPCQPPLWFSSFRPNGHFPRLPPSGPLPHLPYNTLVTAVIPGSSALGDPQGTQLLQLGERASREQVRHLVGAQGAPGISMGESWRSHSPPSVSTPGRNWPIYNPQPKSTFRWTLTTTHLLQRAS